MLAVDTNVLLRAANVGARLHGPCRQRLEEWRRGPSSAVLTWNVCYEFMRNATHPKTFAVPWETRQALRFLEALLASPGFSLLTATPRHATVLGQTLEELPDLHGAIIHDLHTAVIMREHGIDRICTLDGDFHRFPFLTVVDPRE